MRNFEEHAERCWSLFATKMCIDDHKISFKNIYVHTLTPTICCCCSFYSCLVNITNLPSAKSNCLCESCFLEGGLALETHQWMQYSLWYASRPPWPVLAICRSHWPDFGISLSPQWLSLYSPLALLTKYVEAGHHFQLLLERRHCNPAQTTQANSHRSKHTYTRTTIKRHRTRPQ